MNHLILVTLKEMKQLQSNIKLNELDYKAKSEKKLQYQLRIKNFILYYIFKKYSHRSFIHRRC